MMVINMNEQLFTNLTYVLCDIVYYISMHMFFSCISKPIRGMQTCLMSYFVCFTLGTSIYVYSDTVPSYVFTLTSILFLFIICINYEKNIPRCLLFSLFFMLFGMAFELISGYLTAIIFSDSLNNVNEDFIPYICGMVLSRLLLLLFCLISHSLLRNRNTFKRPTMFWIITVLFPAGSIYICYFILYNSSKNNITNYTGILMILIILFVMNIIVFIFYDKICTDAFLKEENARLSYYLQLQEMQQQNVDEYNMQIAQIHHNLKNYLTGITQLIKDAKYEEALNNIEDKREHLILHSSRISSPDSVVNNIINYKIDYAKSKGISVNPSIVLSDQLSADAGDISILLGNGLDNAIEYLLSHRKAQQSIEIKMHYDFGVLNINISNPVSENIKIPSNMLIPSSKKNLFHGLGIQSMKKIAEKYNGSFSITCIDNIFSLSVTMVM